MMRQLINGARYYQGRRPNDHELRHLIADNQWRKVVLVAARATDRRATAINRGAEVAATMPFCELPFRPIPSSPRKGVLSVFGFDSRRRILDNPARTVTVVSCRDISRVDQRLIDTVSNHAKRRLE